MHGWRNCQRRTLIQARWISANSTHRRRLVEAINSRPPRIMPRQASEHGLLDPNRRSSIPPPFHHRQQAPRPISSPLPLLISKNTPSFNAYTPCTSTVTEHVPKDDVWASRKPYSTRWHERLSMQLEN